MGLIEKEGLNLMKMVTVIKNCMFKVNSKGDILMNYLNIPMSNPFLQKLGFLFCVDRGVTIGGNKDARLRIV